MIDDHRPIQTTVLMGILGGLAGFAGALVPEWHGAHPVIRLGIVWTLTAGYALLLVRWGRQRLSAVFFPLIVLGLWGGQQPCGRDFIVMALATLSWIRSGVCFPAPPAPGPASRSCSLRRRCMFGRVRGLRQRLVVGAGDLDVFSGPNLFFHGR